MGGMIAKQQCSFGCGAHLQSLEIRVHLPQWFLERALMTMQFFGVLCGGFDFRQIKEFRGKKKPSLFSNAFNSSFSCLSGVSGPFLPSGDQSPLAQQTSLCIYWWSPSNLTTATACQHWAPCIDGTQWGAGHGKTGSRYRTRSHGIAAFEQHLDGRLRGRVLRQREACTQDAGLTSTKSLPGAEMLLHLQRRMGF